MKDLRSLATECDPRIDAIGTPRGKAASDSLVGGDGNGIQKR
jgi:hypothetical protein